MLGLVDLAMQQKLDYAAIEPLFTANLEIGMTKIPITASQQVIKCATGTQPNHPDVMKARRKWISRHGALDIAPSINELRSDQVRGGR